MKNKELWRESKYVFENERLVSSKNKKEVGVGSRLIANLTAAFYESALKEHAKGKLLDLGCGKVPLYGSYKNFVEDNVCVDWVNTIHKNIHLDYEIDITKKLPFHDNEFDTIILSDVLEHIPEPEKLWGEMSRILSPNGKIIMNVPFFYWLHEEPHDYYRYTKYALRRFVEGAGLELIHLNSLGGAPEVISDVLGKVLLRFPKLGSFFSRAVQSLTLHFVRTKYGQKLSNATRQSFPLAYGLVAQKPVLETPLT